MTLTIGSLFAGIGGIDLGLERAGHGPVLWQVEIDARCRLVLEHHWPNAKRYEDVRSVGAATLAPVDLICGGFPCTDVSSAGKRAGLAGARSGLWFEYLRIVTELRPSWVVVENVASGARAWVDAVLTGLGELGYACLPIPLSAADVGAPHLRRRIFVVATNTDARSESTRAKHAEVASASAPADADQDDVRNKSRWCSGARRQGSEAEPAHDGWSAAQPAMVRVVSGLPNRLDQAHARIQALGNSVVPQCAEVIGHVINQLGAA